LKSEDVKITRVLEQFNGLDKILIDASSIIYIQKIGFFNQLSNLISLHTLPEILAETGFTDLPIEIIHDKFSSETNDQKFIECAKKKKWPIVSEDKKIIYEMKKEKLPYLNTIMMLNYLLFKHKINKQQHSVYFNRLKQIAWYGLNVYEFSEQVFRKIIKLKQL